MVNAFDRHYEVALEQQKMYKDKLADIEKKTEELEDDFYLAKKVPEDVYIRLRTKLAKEKADLIEVLSNLDIESSNLKTYFRWGITISTELTTKWDSSPIPVREKLQKFVFPQGVTYNREKRAFLTSKVNTLFEPIAQLNSISEGDKNKQGSISAALSNWSGGQDSNLRPLAPHASALPGCATTRKLLVLLFSSALLPLLAGHHHLKSSISGYFYSRLGGIFNALIVLLGLQIYLKKLIS